jgi:hypothetical protein
MTAPAEPDPDLFTLAMAGKTPNEAGSFGNRDHKRQSKVRLPPGGFRLTKERTAQADGSKSEKPGGTDKKKRLAAALRRNLAKRKDTKEAHTEDNPKAD